MSRPTSPLTKSPLTSNQPAKPVNNQTVPHFPSPTGTVDPQVHGQLTDLKTQNYKLLNRINDLEQKVQGMQNPKLTQEQLQQISTALSIAGENGKLRLNVTGLLGQTGS